MPPEYFECSYLDELTTDQLNLIQKILTTKVGSHDNPLFELPCTHYARVVLYVDLFYKRMVAEKRIDVFVKKRMERQSEAIKLCK